MDIFELMQEFLKSLGLKWEKTIYTNEIRDRLHVTRNITNEDITDYKMVTIPVEIAEIADKYNIIFKLDISVDLLHFEIYGLNMVMPSCFAIKEEYKELFKSRNLDKEWQKFCLTKKGLVYETAVRNYVIDQKCEIGEETHKKIMEHFVEIHNLKREAQADIKALENDLESFEEVKKEIE